MSAAIQYVIGEDVRLVSSAEETASDVYRMLVSHGLQRQETTPPTHRFESTGDDEQAFRALAHRFLGPEVRHVEAFPTQPITVRTS
jgi:glutamate racemase